MKENKRNNILLGLYTQRLSPVKEGTNTSKMESNPTLYMDYIVKNFGGSFSSGDLPSEHDIAMKHVTKLAKLLKKPVKDVIDDVTRKFANLD
jgi:hypothetical protein